MVLCPICHVSHTAENGIWHTGVGFDLGWHSERRLCFSNTFTRMNSLDFKSVKDRQLHSNGTQHTTIDYSMHNVELGH